MKQFLLLLVIFLPTGISAQGLNATTTHDKVFGKVTFDDGLPATGFIEFIDKASGTTAEKIELKPDGSFEVLLQKKKVFSFLFHNGLFVHYFNQAGNELRTSEDEILSNLELNFTVMQYGLGTALNLDGFVFEPHSEIIREEDKAKLDFLAEWLKARPGIRIQCAGHANEEEDETANKALSRKRATACLDYLVKAGIPADHLLTYGYGASRPLPGAEVFASQNRRTSFIIIENPAMPKPPTNPK